MPSQCVFFNYRMKGLLPNARSQWQFRSQPMITPIDVQPMAKRFAAFLPKGSKKSKNSVALTSELTIENLVNAFIDWETHPSRSHSVEGFSSVSAAFLVFLGVYPRGDELDYWSNYRFHQGTRKLINQLLTSPELSALRRFSQTSSLETVEPGTLLVDVSHTVDYPYNSGIQRVVRKLSTHLVTQKKPVRFFKINRFTGQPHLLKDDEVARLLDFNEGPKNHSGSQAKNDSAVSPKAPTHQRASRFKWALREVFVGLSKHFLIYILTDLKYLLTTIYHRVRNDFLIPWSFRFQFAKAALRVIDDVKGNAKVTVRRWGRALRAKSELESNILYFSHNQVLLPECAFEDNRIKFYLNAKKSQIDFDFSIVIYDLIPIITPEFCSVTEMFTQFCRLLRVADRVNCISESVMKDVSYFLNITLRLTPTPPKLGFLRLAGDFGSSPQPEHFNAPTPSAALASPPSNSPTRPRILCVGTFEPRKNQVSILHAAYSLFQKGLKFELAFAGNPGWKNEQFLSEKQQIDPKEEFVKFYSSISDTELEALYLSSRFSIFCSHAEGFGLPIVESLHYGKPVIVSNRGSMKEIADHFGGCVEANPEKVNEIAAAMERLLTDDQFLAKKTAEISMKECISWAQYADRLFQFVTR